MHIKLLKTKIFILALLIFGTAGTEFAQNNPININALTDETQKTSDAPDEMTIIWWIPEEFWRASLEQDKAISPTQIEDFLKVLRPYTIVVVVDGKIGAIGGVTYKTETVTKNNIQIIDTTGSSFRPVSDEKIGPDVKNLMSVMKPILVNMMGPMGQNMHFVVFPSKNVKGQEIVNVRKEGSFSVKLDTREFKWKLPLNSLVPQKTCPVDGEKLSGAWKFCPWHGAGLKN